MCSSDLRSTGVDRPATPLARLPEIAIVAPGAEFALGDDPHRRVDIDFTPPAKCAAYRVRVVPSLAGMLGDSFDAALLPLDASGVAHARFLDGAMNGRRTALDWRFVRASALATGAASVRWFIEGEDDVGQVVARSRLIEMRLAK